MAPAVERAALTPDGGVSSPTRPWRWWPPSTPEAGVRQLERALGEGAAEGRDDGCAHESGAVGDPPRRAQGVLVGPGHLRVAQSARRYPGVATGLAVTGTGGDCCSSRRSRPDRRLGARPTGDARPRDEGVSVDRAVLPAVARTRARHRRRDSRRSAHAPARAGGAVPKDGPSAGVTMVTALASLASGRPVRRRGRDDRRGDAAGRVLPIGGVKQKLLAAHRAGLTEVIIPARNEPDLDDLPPRCATR